MRTRRRANGASNNTIADNTVLHNGPLRGITILAALDGSNISANNVIQGNNVVGSNTAQGNAAWPGLTSVFDLNDQNPGCDNNTWAGNVFGTASSACIS